MTNITLAANHCWIDTTAQNLAKNYGNFGIYILGIKNAQGRIVPYYVGKSEGPIVKRVKEHVDDLFSPCTTYAIFSDSFLLNRGVGITNVNQGIERVAKPSLKYDPFQFLTTILYLNERSFFQNLWKSNPNFKIIGDKWPSKPFPLCLMDFSGNLTELNNVISSRSKVYSSNNLFFATLSTGLGVNKSLKKRDQKLLACLETYVKFSLIANTVGESQTLGKMWENLNGISVSLNIPGIPCNALKSEFYPLPK